MNKKQNYIQILIFNSVDYFIRRMSEIFSYKLEFYICIKIKFLKLIFDKNQLHIRTYIRSNILYLFHF